MELLRSMLYIPGNDMRKISKAPKITADAVILDLEDAVPVDEKEMGRIFVKDSIDSIASSGVKCYVRINGPETGFFENDLENIVRKGLDGIVLPKSESEDDVKKLEKEVTKLERERGLDDGDISIIPLIETPKGVINLENVSLSSKRVNAIAFGAVDYTRSLGAEVSEEGEELLYPRTKISNVSNAFGIPAIDTPWVKIEDKEGLIKDSKSAKRLGFDGKQVIHPDQLDAVNKIFSPSEEEIERSKKIIEAFEKAEEKGLGAASLEGEMIDIATYKGAKETVAKAKAIEKKS